MSTVPSAPTAAIAAVAPVARAQGSELVADAGGRALALSPGQVLAARVVTTGAGLVELAVAGGRMAARTDVPLAPGQTLSLVVGQVDADRVQLQLAAAAGPAPAEGGGAAGGLSGPAARALAAALADAGVAVPRSEAGALTARAAAAGVASPASAAAFARLVAAGLPATPAAVAGLAELVEGPPLGRALAALVDAALAGAPRALGAGTPAPVPPGPAPGTGTPPGAAPPGATSPPAVAPSGAGAVAPSVAPPGPPAAAVPAAAAPSPPGGGAPPAAPPAAPSHAPAPPPLPSASGAVPPPPSPTPPPAAPGGAPGGPAAPPSAPPAGAALLPATPSGLIHALEALVDHVAQAAASGDEGRLREALGHLGRGLEGDLAAGRPPEAPPVRALLTALATHAATDGSLARAAAGLSDALGAQGLAAAVATPAGPPPDPTAAGAYLQVPLPGGQTAEIRVAPDAGGEGGGAERPRTLAFLLDLSALGPVMIEAVAGPSGVDAVVRVQAPEARRFVAGRTAELADALGGTGARVRVERLAADAPTRLVAPPAASGLDLRA